MASRMKKSLGVALLLYDNYKVGPQETQEARKKSRGGLLVACFSEGEAIRRTRLPVAHLYWAAVKTRCVGPSSWHASYIYPTTVRTFGYTPVGHGARP